jgi:hypothetical protein
MIDYSLEKHTQHLIYPSPRKILLSSLAFSHWKKLLHLPIGPCYSSVQKLPPMKKCVAVIPVLSLVRGIEDDF